MSGDPFDWDKVEPEPLTALAQAIADNVHGIAWCSNPDAMSVLNDLWDAGFRVVRHPVLADRGSYVGPSV